jgi:hypothetical protein
MLLPAMQESTAMLEDYTELLSQAAVRVSSALTSEPPSRDIGLARSATAVLWKLQMTLSGEALLKFQVRDLCCQLEYHREF